MSVERSSSQTSPADSAQRSEARQGSGKPREPAPQDKVDRFRDLMGGREATHESPRGSERRPPEQPQVAQRPEQPAPRDASQHPARESNQHPARETTPHPPQAYGQDRDAGPLLADAATERDARPARIGDELQRDDGLGDADSSRLPPAEMAALWQAQLAVRDAVAIPQNATSQANPTAFAELIERHVRQLLVSQGGLDSRGEGQVMLRMSDATLPGTDLMLTRTADGWTLRADVRSRDSYDAIRRAMPELTRRFAERHLGALTVEPHYHG